MDIPVFKKNQLAVAILLAAPMFGAQAALIELNLNASTSAQVDTNSAVTNNSGFSSSDVNSSVYDDSGSSHTYANSSGYTDGSFNTNSGGYGTYNSSASFLQSYSVENDPFDQNFDFNFSIENGSLDVYCDDGYGYGGDGYGEDSISDDGYGAGLGCSEANASYGAEIRLNGVAIWHSMFALAFDGTDVTHTSSGEMLGIYSPFSTYFSWNDQSFTIDLGTFAAGEIFTLDYEVTLNVSGINGNSYARFGDPNGFGQGGSPFTTSVSVPEPTSLGILALGFGLLGLNRSRKNKVR